MEWTDRIEKKNTRTDRGGSDGQALYEMERLNKRWTDRGKDGYTKDGFIGGL